MSNERVVSSAIHFHFASGGKEYTFSLKELVSALEWRNRETLLQEEVDALNVTLNIDPCVQELFFPIVAAWRSRPQ